LNLFPSQVTELLLRNRASVIYPEIFRAPCRKNHALDRKMIVNVLMVSTSSITLQSLGKIILRSPAVRPRCENVVFVFCHAQSPEHCAFEGCIARTSIALPFVGRF